MHDLLHGVLQWLLRGVRRGFGVVEPAYVPHLCCGELRRDVQPRLPGALLPEHEMRGFCPFRRNFLSRAKRAFAVLHSIIRVVFGRVAGVRKAFCTQFARACSNFLAAISPMRIPDVHFAVERSTESLVHVRLNRKIA